MAAATVVVLAPETAAAHDDNRYAPLEPLSPSAADYLELRDTLSDEVGSEGAVPKRARKEKERSRVYVENGR